MLWNTVYPGYSPESGARGKASQPEGCVLAEARGEGRKGALTGDTNRPSRSHQLLKSAFAHSKELNAPGSHCPRNQSSCGKHRECRSCRIFGFFCHCWDKQALRKVRKKLKPGNFPSIVEQLNYRSVPSKPPLAVLGLPLLPSCFLQSPTAHVMPVVLWRARLVLPWGEQMETHRGCGTLLQSPAWHSQHPGPWSRAALGSAPPVSC